MTPTHIELSCALHQSTRNKELVELFSNAGHIINYTKTLQVDTALAEHTLATLNMTDGTIIPSNLGIGKFVNFTADNIDINDETNDGKNTFMQLKLLLGREEKNVNKGLDSLKLSKRSKFEIPKILNTLIAANKVPRKI